MVKVVFFPAIVNIGIVGTDPSGTVVGRGTRRRTSLLSFFATIDV